MKPTDPRHVPKRWLRNVLDGTIYEWNEILAQNAKCEEVGDWMIHPEAYVKTASQIPEVDGKAAEVTKKRGRLKKDLGVDEMLESQTPPPFTSSELSTEVGKGWPK